jgi:hypothetical protein
MRPNDHLVWHRIGETKPAKFLAVFVVETET